MHEAEPRGRSAGEVPSSYPGWAFICGAMKSGTTTLFEHLGSHPEVCPCDVKEPNFISKDRYWERGLDWYRDLFPWDAAHHRWFLEASTSYTKRPFVDFPVERFDSLPGDKRFIFIMRDPVARIRSHIAYGKVKGWSTFTGADGEIPGKALEVSRYAQQLDPYRQQFGMDRVKLMFFEDLIQEPDRVLEECCEFLDLRHQFPDDAFEDAYNVTSDLLISPDWYSRISGLAPVRWVKKIPGVKHFLARLLPGFGTPDGFELNAQQRAYVLSELEPDIRRLRNEFGVDISRWGYDV